MLLEKTGPGGRDVASRSRVREQDSWASGVRGGDSDVHVQGQRLRGWTGSAQEAAWETKTEPRSIPGALCTLLLCRRGQVKLPRAPEGR